MRIAREATTDISNQGREKARVSSIIATRIVTLELGRMS